MGRRTGLHRASALALRRFHRSGIAPVKVLLIGDRRQLLATETDPAGVVTAAERVADRIWLTTRRGVDLDVLGDLAPVLRAITGVLGRWRLWRYDVVVVVLGDGAGTRPRAQLRTMDLLREVLADVGEESGVIVVGDSAGRAGSDVERRLCRAVQALATDRVRLCDTPRSNDVGERARLWATAIGIEAAHALAAAAPHPVPARRTQPDEEVARQGALDALQVVGRPPDPRLDDLVELARTAFGTESAEINFLDRDRQWKMAVAGADRGESDRAHSFCNQTIRAPEPFVVGDSLLDPRLRAAVLALGPHPIRFYAAHPIESIDGYRIGSFCVYDPEPRDVSGLDLAVLRDLALLAQAELIAQDAPPPGAASRLRDR